jgi:cell division septum initiation protein DivIVA
MSNSQRFRRSLLGYRRRDVDEAVDALSTRLNDAEQTSDMSAVVGRHLGDLLTRFADAVDEGERDARAAADALVRDARAEATAVFDAARRQYEAHATARRSAMSQLEGALGQMSDALAALAAMPEFPAVPASLVVAKVEEALEVTPPETEVPRSDLVA